jgi:hypothetical protein
MNLYFYTGAKGYAATTSADLALLVAALADPSTTANAAAISRITGKIGELVAADTGVPLNLYFSDDGTTYAAWSTSSATTLIVGLGDQSPERADTVASTTSFTISGNARVGTLALNTAEMYVRIREARTHGYYNDSIQLTLHIRKSTGGVTESVGLIPITVHAGVLADTPEPLVGVSYVTTTAARAGFVHNESGITSLTGGGAAALDGIVAGLDSYPVGCVLFLSAGDVGRNVILKGSYIAATDLGAGLIKPLNSDATLNPVHWKII